MPDGGEEADRDTISQIFYALLYNADIDDEWNSFEECLGYLNYQDVIDQLDYDDEDDDGLSHYYRNLEDLLSEMSFSFPEFINSVFKDWIDSIDISSVGRKYRFDCKDLFLTFNYTNTLEDVYDIENENICHIHGDINEGTIIAGHNNNHREFDDYDEIIRYQVEDIHNSLMKDCIQCYANHSSFFNKIYSSNITDIIIFGHNVKDSDIDDYYYEEIFKRIDTSSITLWLTNYSINHGEAGSILRKLRSLGFKGVLSGKPFEDME